jgi:Xaa-Pro aminopeptidase
VDFSTRFHSAGLDKGRLRRLMQEGALDGILLTSPENVFYTTGYTALPSSGNPILYTLRNRLPFFSFVNREAAITLLCWGFSAQQVDFGYDTLVGFNDFDGATEALRTLLQQQLPSSPRLAVESTCPRYVLQQLEGIGLPSSALAGADDLLAQLRLIKSSEETELLKTSTAIIEQTVAELYEILHRGMSRLDLTREAKYRMIRNGATGISHITFSFAQANPEVAIGELLGDGRLATLDLGGIYNGYCSDNRRYAYCGEIPASLQQRYEAMVDIVDRVGAALVPGRSYAEIYRLALDLYAQHGISRLARFNHVGHNIGLETEEEWLTDTPHAAIREGMVINIELYALAETGEQIGDEETYIIEADGPTRISVLPREIRRV